MRRELWFWVWIFSLSLALAGVVLGTALQGWFLEPYRDIVVSEPYRGCRLIREIELWSMEMGHGDPILVGIVQRARRRMKQEGADPDRIRSYVTAQAVLEGVPISWE